MLKKMRWPQTHWNALARAWRWAARALRGFELAAEGLEEIVHGSGSRMAAARGA
ncbi:hypothetical protein [Achromobacter ruhlandii]|uniref:hypothetical protein n=1 Tax=Achromobacter ruhlandii TaxID=72557 RepID=UPI001EEF1EF1|nr:hypothetical protein [Achromobacter ruhlandii]MCZ8396516.1 hypothetical protein [Achromobacter ruhlandii]